MKRERTAGPLKNVPIADERFENRSTPCQQLSASAPEISRRQLLQLSNLIAGAAALPVFPRIGRAENLSLAPSTHHCRISARGRGRHHGASDSPMAIGASRSAIHY